MKIERNLAGEELSKFLASLKANDGYCPCRIGKNPDNKCICKEFREQESGVCHCGLYKKTKE